MSFGSRIRELRKDLNLSQSDFGKKIGVSGTTISQYESDLRFPAQEILVKICVFLNISSDYLLGLSDMKSPSLKKGDIPLDCKLFTEEQIETINTLVRAFANRRRKND